MDDLPADATASPSPSSTAAQPSTAPQPAEDGFEGMVATARGMWHDERIEVVAAILLSLATVLSAWGAYQATRWSGEQANAYASSAAYRAAAGRQGTVASRQIQIDVSTFLSWSQAKAAGEDRLATFLESRFRAEFKPAFQAWLAEPTLDAQSLPVGTPFERPEYTIAAQREAEALNAMADAALAEAQYDNQVSDNFVLTAVLFASVLFFAGTAAKFRPQWIRWTMIGVAVVVFSIGLVIEFSLPQSIGF